MEAILALLSRLELALEGLERTNVALVARIKELEESAQSEKE